ncbi:fatty acid oxidation complex subunit alpha FadJ, partial [Vibrio sp. PNB22_3_1]
KQLRAKKAKKLGVVDASVPLSILEDVALQMLEKGKRKAEKVSNKEKLMSGTGLGRKMIFEQAAKKTRAKTRGNYPAAEAILDV